LREGLRLVEARERLEAARLTAFQEAAQTGIANLDEGRYKQFDSADELADYLHELSEQTPAGARNHS
jgi:antitoxin ParD1/3/4